VDRLTRKIGRTPDGGAPGLDLAAKYGLISVDDD
jgi:hypothetical protein